MGLDITAYSHINIIGYADEFDEDLEMQDSGPDYVHQEFLNHSFPWHVEVEGWEKQNYLLWKETENTKSYRFHAGSYGGYGVFRSSLYPQVPSVEVWETPEKHKDMPYFELVNFSDCEGTIGPAVSAHLYEDFRKGRTIYLDSIPDDPWTRWYMERYDHWTTAFDLARHNGIVSFH